MFRQIRGQYVPLNRAVLVIASSLGISRLAARRRIEYLRKNGRFIEEVKICGKISYKLEDFNRFLEDKNDSDI